MSCSVFVGVSLDGFIARPDGGLDWLDPPADEELPDHGYDEFIAGIDAIVMGRGTWDKVLTFDHWPYDRPVVVLSSRPLEIPVELGSKVERFDGSPAEVVAMLAERGLEALYIDGGITIQRFLADGLIDRLVITRLPVLIGSGVPLFGPLNEDIRLKHVATRFWPAGLVQSEYQVR